MKYIYNYILSLFNYSTKKIILPNELEIKKLKNNNNDVYVAEVQFKLTQDSHIDIIFTHKSIQNDSVESISVVAENIANLIVLINNGLLKKELIKVIKDLKKINMNNDKNTLLLDNILFFNNLLQEELKIIKKEIGPLVKPSNVFRSE